MIEVTTAMAFEFPFKLSCEPRLADTAVVMSPYGPLTKKPDIIM